MYVISSSNFSYTKRQPFQSSLMMPVDHLPSTLWNYNTDFPNQHQVPSYYLLSTPRNDVRFLLKNCI